MKRLLITTFSLVLSMSAASAAGVNMQANTLEPITDFQFSDYLSDRAACNLKNHNDTVAGFWSNYVDGIRTVAFYDPASCGSPTYPFQINSLGFTLFDPGGYQWPVTVDVVVFDAHVSGDSCLGPQAELCRFTIVCDSASFALPNVGLAEFPVPCCVSGPFFIGIEYNDDGLGPYPSVLFDSDGPEVCKNWIYFTDGSWHDWAGFWTPPVPGDPLFWVQGTTESYDCGSRVVLNELNVEPGQTGAELLEYKYQWIELYNAASEDVDLTGWTLSDSIGSTVASLPSWTLPAGSYLTVHWESGADDNDFSDRDGHYYTGDTTRTFSGATGECGLHTGIPSSGNIVDYLLWGDGSVTPGLANSWATAAGIWADGDFFDPGTLYMANTIGRVFNGWDTDTPDDWMVYGWQQYITVGLTQPVNPSQFEPEKELVIEETSPTFKWHGASVDFYQLQVDDDPTFSSPEIDVTVTDTFSNSGVVLDISVYSFRVRGIQGDRTSHWSAPWIFMVYPGIKSSGRQVNCPFYWQHKDTDLLCIWDDARTARPGCAETGPHLWDGPHPSAKPPGNEPHCDNNCARASIAMVNAKYGGDLSQDRVAYHYFQEITDRVAGPEGDMGHGSWMVGNDFINTISWALNGAAINAIPRPAGGFTFAQLKGWVDQVGCFVTNFPGHVVVTDGYLDINLPDLNFDIEVIYIHDPARGASRAKIYKWSVAGVPQPAGLNQQITWVFIQPPAGVTGRMQEATILTDADGDGIMDFDEGLPGYPATRPRRFQAKFNEVDSDSDQVSDYMEVKNYTHHDQAGHHPGHENDALTFPDIDGDGLRAEHDCDSDNDKDFDGGEDINGDSFNPIPAGGGCTTETCQFDAAEECIKIAVDKDNYLLGEPVYIVDWHGSRETHTYHQNSTYNYELGPTCLVKSDGDPIAWNGSFTTNVGGHANTTFVMYCWFPGTYYLYADVLSDHTYSTPDNWDPWTCWSCDIDWYHGWHYYYDYTYHNPTYDWPIYPYPMNCITQDEAIQTTYNTIEVPWWWWCYSWPPITTDYWLGVQVPEELIFSGQLQLIRPPEFVQETENCTGAPINQFIPTEIVALDLTSSHPPDVGNIWLGFEIQNWQIPDSFMVTRFEFAVTNSDGTKLANEPMVKIIAGNSEYGWAPTMYDSIPLVGLPSGGCCTLAGDFNGDGTTDVADLSGPTSLVAFMFLGGPPPPCPAEGDFNGDGNLDVSDLTGPSSMVAFMFQGGPAPVCGP